MTSSKWYQQVWLPFAAATYILICIFDFMIMPIYVTAHNSRIENAVFKNLEGKDLVAFADMISKNNQALRQWNPLTLMGAGMFHLAFGALLTGGAITRGLGRKSEIEGYYRYGPGGEGYGGNSEYNNVGRFQRGSYGNYNHDRYGSGSYRPPARYSNRSGSDDGPVERTTD